MKRLLLIPAAILILLLVAAAGLYLWRSAIAEHYARQSLEARGLKDVSLSITSLNTSGVVVENLSASNGRDGTPSLRLKRAEATWSLKDLRDGKIENITLSGLTIQLRQEDDDILIAGLPLSDLRGTSGRADAGSNVTLDEITISDTTILLQSNYGNAELSLDGNYARNTGGAATLQAMSSDFQFGPTTLRETDLQASVSLRPDRSFNGAASTSLSVENNGRSYPNLQAAFSFSGTDFLALARDRNATEAQVTFDLSAPSIPLDMLAPYTDYITFAAGQMPETSTLSARGLLKLAGGIISLENINEDYLSARTDTGLNLELSAPKGTTLGRWSDTRSWLNLDYDINGLKASPAGGHIDLGREQDGPIRINTDFTAAEWQDRSFTLVPGTLSFTGNLDGTHLSGDVQISGGPSRLETNNMVLRNLPVSADFSLDADLATRTAEITVPRGCIALPRPSARTRNGSFNFTSAKFCPPSAGPLVLTAYIDDTGTFTARADGIITANSLDTTVGETSITGRPPRAIVSLDINGRTATARTGLYGGDIQINELINLSGMNGNGLATYKDGEVSIRGNISDVLLTDLREPTSFSPLAFQGTFAVQQAQATFNGTLAIPGVESFSTMDGRYDLRAQDGQARLTFGPLTLNPDGFQLTDVLPPLKGFVENAGGPISGTALLKLAREGLQTGANLKIDGISFSGPTPAITRTGNLALTADFDGLLPLKTSGVQTATIGLIDLDALKLENGEIQFSAPGDGTMQVLSAVWPWFGGTLSIKDAIVPLDGSSISVPMRVQNIDISQLLAFFGVNGLSGAGRLDGTLPIIIENGNARIENGTLRAITPGNIAYESAALQRAAENAGAGGKLAFEALRSFDFDQLVLTINGDLAGDINLGLRLEGRTDLEGLTSQPIDNTGIHFNININAPLSGLVRQFDQQRQSKQSIFDDLVREKGLELEFGDAERVQP
ncbi:MAG: YdbH domain-containing protein [Aquisalinus sp.]|nr:YdbH domain-containing protein [Aquisalinus sp.]